MKTLILIPTLNAQKKLLDILSEIEIHSPDSDVLVIDYGSTDRTKHLLNNNDINHLILPLTTTYYHAMSLGMIYAHKNHYDIVVEWDDKGKFKTEDIKYLITSLKRSNVDLTLGSRFINKKAPFKIRWYGTKMLRRATWLVTGKKITDPTLRMRAYGKKAIKIFAENENFGPAPDIIALLLKNKLTYNESYTELSGNHKRQLHNSVIVSIGEIFRWSMWIIFVLPFRKKLDKQKKARNNG